MIGVRLFEVVIVTTLLNKTPSHQFCKMDIYIVNGANLNLLGKREPHLYGTRSFDDYFVELQSAFPQIALHYFQSNHEGALIDYLQQIGFTAHAIIFNPGAHTHTSIALRDTVAAITAPLIEVHISNIYAREEFRHHSHISPVAHGVISGLGLAVYRLAIDYVVGLK
jgi:3-dehydroquinate dehydratase-2